MKKEWFPMINTLCWRCPTVYPIKDHDCPNCGAANANHDFEKAHAEMRAEDDCKELVNED